MAALMVTREMGGRTRETEMTVAQPQQIVSESELQPIGASPDINGIFLADTLSAFIDHERAAIALGVAAAEQSSRGDLRQLHESLAAEHVAHMVTYEELAASIGLDPLYVSPAARMSHYQGRKHLETSLVRGSVDDATMDMALLDAAILAGERCLDNRRIIGEIAEGMPSGDARDAFETAAERFSEQGEQALGIALTARHTMLVGGVLPRVTAG